MCVVTKEPRDGATVVRHDFQEAVEIHRNGNEKIWLRKRDAVDVDGRLMHLVAAPRACPHP
jgi:hypothetical protein